MGLFGVRAEPDLYRGACSDSQAAIEMEPEANEAFRRVVQQPEPSVPLVESPAVTGGICCCHFGAGRRATTATGLIMMSLGI